MMKFNYKQLIRERITAKCDRHPRYNPEQSGKDGIRGGCSTCWDIYSLHLARLKLDAAIREFTRRAGPWSRPRERRRRKANSAGSAPEDAPEVQP